MRDQTTATPTQFTVLQGVRGDGLVNTMDILPQSQNLETWEIHTRDRARNARLEWLADHPLFGSVRSLRSDWWRGNNHQLAILDRLPTVEPQYSPQVMATLPPGSTIEAQQVHTFDSRTFQELPSSGPSSSPSMGVLQMIQILYHNNSQEEDDTTMPQVGYVVWSIDGYNFLAPGTPKDLTAPWYWRVTCPLGAWIRTGPSLSSDKLMTIPFGALVQVHAKVVNDMALSRLQVQYKDTWGWCSEFLNPLSGQRGPILQPLPMLTPLSIQICLPGGALVRDSIELSSPSGTTIRYNEFVTITRRVFSEHPGDACIQRLRLADGQGWISQCLNTKAREAVVDEAMYRTVPSFDPFAPGQFHLDHLPNLPGPDTDLSNAENALGSRSDPPMSASSLYSDDSNNLAEEASCVVCLTAERNATIVHGETGHVACCLVCARILRARGNGCPVCRLAIDLVIQHFHA